MCNDNCMIKCRLERWQWYSTNKFSYWLAVIMGYFMVSTNNSGASDALGSHWVTDNSWCTIRAQTFAWEAQRSDAGNNLTNEAGELNSVDKVWYLSSWILKRKTLGILWHCQVTDILSRKGLFWKGDQLVSLTKIFQRREGATFLISTQPFLTLLGTIVFSCSQQVFMDLGYSLEAFTSWYATSMVIWWRRIYQARKEVGFLA